MARAELKPEDLTAIIDTAEQLPLDLAPLHTVVKHLTTGDYSIVGLEHVISIERKSLTDFLQCVGRERARFERVIERLVAYPSRALVVEATWPVIERGDWPIIRGKQRSKVTASSALGSLLGWAMQGVPVLMAGDHERAGRYVSRLLFIAARRRWRELRQFSKAQEKRDEQSD